LAGKPVCNNPAQLFNITFFMNKLLIALFSVAALALPFVTSAQTGAPAMPTEPAAQTAPAVTNTDSASPAKAGHKAKKKKKHKKKKSKKAKH
jgi:Ni/Co efflux regulator RcnB